MNEWEGPAQVSSEISHSSSKGLGSVNRRPSHTELLRYQKAQLEEKLGRINRALEALEKHPDIEEVMNLVAQAM